MSDESMEQPNIRGLLAYAQRKAEGTQKRVHRAIDQLLQEHQTVNFSTIAKAANTTKSYLYANAGVRGRVEALRTQQGQERMEQQWAERQQQQARTDKTKDVLLTAKDRRIKTLEEENRKLKAELKIANGKLYERV